MVPGTQQWRCDCGRWNDPKLAHCPGCGEARR